MLDRCHPSKQLEEVRLAHEWLAERLGDPPSAFAYPNGNHTEVVQQELARLDYRAAVLFDHQLTTIEERYRMSRLRVNADDRYLRFKAVVAGLHPLAHNALRRG